MVDSARQRFQFADYVLLEETSTVKHEFLDGSVWAMVGGSPAHARVTANVARALSDALEGQACAVYSSDLRVRVLATGLATYPDVTVVCSALELDPEDPRRHTVVNPKLIVEVLSPSTQDYDRGEKLTSYQTIRSLEQVILIDPLAHRVEVWTRGADGWERAVHADGLAALPRLNCSLSLEALFRDPLERA